MKRRAIIQGHDGPIEIDGDNQTVVKNFWRLDHESAVRKIEREVTHASRLFEVLSQVDGLACPKILAWDVVPTPRVVMGLCPGEPLSRFLTDVGSSDVRITEIANKIHDGLEIYTGLFGEPYHDFCFQNMLYDESTRTLTFLDFSAPDRLARSEGGSALEASLGNFVGWACYEMVRPSRLFIAKHGYLGVLSAVLAAFDDAISRQRVRALTHAVFFRLTQAGSVTRRAYYRTAGLIIANRYLHQLKLGSSAAGIVHISGV